MSFGVDAKSWKKFIDYDVVIDSGAFSIFNSGKKLDIDDYLTFIKQLPEHWKFISFDVIPMDNMSKKETAVSAQASYENYLYLAEKHHNIIPVLHYGEDISYFKKYMEHTDYICCGRLLGNYEKSYEHYRNIFKLSQDKIKIHGLAASDKRLLFDFPFYSIDSITYKKSINKKIRSFWSNGKLKSLLYQNIRYWLMAEKQITNLWKERGVNWDT